MYIRKPKQWIARFTSKYITCKDELHTFLIKEFGFENYCKHSMWKLNKDVIREDADLNLKFWMQNAMQKGLQGKPPPREFTAALLGKWIEEHDYLEE